MTQDKNPKNRIECRKHKISWDSKVYYYGCPLCIAEKINKENKKLIQARNKMKGGKK